MSSSPSSARFAFATLLATIVFGSATSACGIFGSDDPAAPPAEDAQMPSRGTPNMDVGGPADPSELTDQFGVFVAPNGQPHTDGNHARPAASIQDGIDLAKRVGKRVYVCAGTFHEQITLADSISIIGGLDCTNNEWNIGKPGARTRIEAPKSPAVTATNITSPTRLEGLDVVAPDATTPSGSSIALIADHAGTLTIAKSKLTAGNAMAGVDGGDGIQLKASPWDSQPATTAAACAPNTTCTHIGFYYYKSAGAHGGTNTCIGAPSHAAEPGGDGGSGGLWQPVNDVSAYHFHPYQADANKADPGVTRTAAPGADGTPGTNANEIGTISRDGYVPASGTAGADGAPGFGGSGGAGRTPEPDYDPNTAPVSGVWRGFGGAGGGPGGCPGLGGTPGKGGGASIAALLLESPVAFEAAEIVSRSGGSGGLGAFGSAPTDGGPPGPNVYFPLTGGQYGGRGGAAGVSGNGANGPSLGIAYAGTKPNVNADTKVTVGTAGAAIPARSRTTLGVTKTIPATSAGIAKDILGL